MQACEAVEEKEKRKRKKEKTKPTKNPTLFIIKQPQIQCESSNLILPWSVFIENKWCQICFKKKEICLNGINGKAYYSKVNNTDNIKLTQEAP